MTNRSKYEPPGHADEKAVLPLPQSQFAELPDDAPEDLKRKYAEGETLCIILSRAIDFERSKKRKRMVPESGLRVLSPLRIYQDINTKAERVKNHHPAPRTATRLRRMKALLKAHSSGTLDASSIEPWVWLHLGVNELDNQDELIRDPDLFSARLGAAITEVINSNDYAVDKRGGRETDPRMDSFLYNLAFIYRAYTGYRATYSQAHDGSGQQSPFFLFAEKVVQIFFMDGEEAEWATKYGALQIAIRRISKFEREDESFSDEELDRLLSPTG